MNTHKHTNTHSDRHYRQLPTRSQLVKSIASIALLVESSAIDDNSKGKEFVKLPSATLKPSAPHPLSNIKAAAYHITKDTKNRHGCNIFCTQFAELFPICRNCLNLHEPNCHLPSIGVLHVCIMICVITDCLNDHCLI